MTKLAFPLLAVWLVAPAASAVEVTKPSPIPPPAAGRTGEARPRLTTRPNCDQQPGFKKAAESLPEDTAVVLDITVHADGSVGGVEIVQVNPESPEGREMAGRLRTCWSSARYTAGKETVHLRPRVMLKKETRPAAPAPGGTAAPKK